MTTWIALFRGINVGGKHTLPMKVLKALLEQNGCVEVQTYIQSGNALFRSKLSDADRVAKRISAAVSADHGFEPRVLALTFGELQKAAAGNPFPEAGDDPKSLHLFFLAERAKKPDLAGLESLKANGEDFVLRGKVFYLYTPNGFGTSKLAGRAERLIGVPATARNWRTVKTLLEMAEGYA